MKEVSISKGPMVWCALACVYLADCLWCVYFLTICLGIPLDAEHSQGHAKS